MLLCKKTNHHKDIVIMNYVPTAVEVWGVGGNNLSYDAADNLTKDKDGYTYHYDYENRIIKINKSNDTISVAEYSYDALGRRTEKKDCISSSKTRRYYYSNNWQILCEYSGNDSFKAWYAYGNYIDEVLLMGTPEGSVRYFVHDHLYSPVALMHAYAGSTIYERYEYDAYGKPKIMYADYTEKQPAVYLNKFLFTGREFDILDSGSLKIQYNRNRSYDYYTGRWLQQDPLGYVDGLNLYEYVKSNPSTGLDPMGNFIPIRSCILPNCKRVIY